MFQVDLRKVKANSNPLNCGRAPTVDGVARIKASITKGFPVDCKVNILLFQLYQNYKEYERP